MVRINKCIELIQQNQAIFAVSAPELTYDCGVEMSQTWADLIQFDFEHHPFDTVGLAQFMKGLRDGGLHQVGMSHQRLSRQFHQIA